MEPSPSPEELDALFALADLGVRTGLAGHPAPRVDAATLAPALREPAGAFVTLEVAGDLNGCIGSIVPEAPLGVAVPRLAWAAAFDDPRLPPLTAADYPSLEIKLSLIGPLEPVPAGTEAELAAHMRPGVDGVLIRSGAADATFLPAVWQKVPDALSFLRHLEAKAGLRPGQWPHGLQAWRYTTSDHRRKAVDIDRRWAA
ncbi:MAG TPA: AmmeMemoRadiSam system protein A [Acidimicrobiales bacterium]|nr:AmmeMemoRadiSam system protein A [Acidimicrobiales bacterium]